MNVPLEPPAGERAWREIVERLVPAVAAAFGPSFLVTQHGADSHAWDPLAHLRVTTTAMGAAARLADRTAHRYTKDGAWLATGGGGYDAYRVVPRSWSLVWLAGAHREPPEATPLAWRERWSAEAQRFDQAPLPEAFFDEPNAGLPRSDLQSDAERRSLEVLALVRRLVLPAVVREAEDAGWWSALDELERPRTPEADDEPAAATEPTLVAVDPATLERLGVVHGVLPVAGAGVSTSILRSAARAGASIVGAVAGDRLVGVALAHEGRLLGLGVTPARRQRGLARALLGRLVETVDAPLVAEPGLAERDPVNPLPVDLRARIARSLLEGAGFRVAPAPDPVARHDATALVGRR